MRIVICDGNADDVKKYKEVLSALCDKHSVALEIKCYRENGQMLFALEHDPNRVDLILMETEFDEKLDGIQSARKLREFGYANEIIFCTRMRRRMSEAFDVGALHFIEKEVTPDARVEEIFLLAKAKIEKKGQEVITCSCAGESRNIPLTDIFYFEFSRRLIVVHYKDGTFEFYSTLGKLENLLCTKGFMRNHKAFLVSIRAIDYIAGSEIYLKNGETLPLSRTYSKDVRAAFGALQHTSC